MRVALYLRRSTQDLQPDSLMVQEELLTRYAAEHDHTITNIFRDSASGRTTKRRHDFQALISTISRGATFEAILVRDVSRWGRFDNVDEAAYWEFFCLTHGVRVVYAEETFTNDHTPYQVLLKTLKRVLASEFSREKSHTVQYAQARVTRLGFLRGGCAPYGMRRALIDQDGTVVQTLERGEHKQLSTHRVKLVPGPPHEVAVVRYVFATYATTNATCNGIATKLNHLQLDPRIRWHCSHVHRMLHTETYTGTASFTYRTNPGTEPVIRTPNAWEPIIPLTDWHAVHARLQGSTGKKTNATLAADLRRAFERWGCVEPRMLDTDDPYWLTFKNRFPGGVTEALRTAYADEHESALAHVRSMLERHFHVADHDHLLLLDDYLLVGFVESFPRPAFRTLRWDFAFTGNEQQDVTIGLGFSPPPHVAHVDLFVFHNWKWHTKKRRVYPPVHHPGWPVRFAPKDEERLVRSLRFARYSRSERAAQAIRRELGEAKLVNLSEIGRRLGIPNHTIRYVYHRLEAKGLVRAIQRKKPGRRLTIICERCTKQRKLQPSIVLKSITGLCTDCYLATVRNRVTLTCSACGRVRTCSPKQAAERKTTLCYACSRGKDTAYRLRRLIARRPVEAAKKELLFAIATSLIPLLQASRAFLRPALRNSKHRRYPTIYWTSPQTGERHRLTIDCTDDYLSTPERSDSAAARIMHEQQTWAAGTPTAHARRTWVATLTVPHAIIPRADG